MNRYASILILGIIIMAAAPVRADLTLTKFTRADNGQAIMFYGWNMFNLTEGMAYTRADDRTSVTLYQTADGGATWSEVATISTNVVIPPVDISVDLHPAAVTVVSYFGGPGLPINETVCQLSRDQGKTWIDMAGSIRAFLGDDKAVIYSGSSSDAGTWYRVSLYDGHRWMIFAPHSGEAMAGQTMAFHFDSSQAKFNLQSPPFSELGFSPSHLQAYYSGNVFTMYDALGDAAEPGSSGQFAAVSLDGGGSYIVFYRSPNSAADEAGFDFGGALAVSDSSAWLCFGQVQENESGAWRPTAVKIKKTTDGGASWSTVAVIQGLDECSVSLAADQAGDIWGPVRQYQPDYLYTGVYLLEQAP